jgi:hypothetical protein
MKNLRGLAILLLCLAAAIGCRRKDIRTARIHVPQMTGPECRELILAVVNKQQGVQGDKVTTNPARRDVVVPYDSLVLSLKNIEYALARAGFAANDIPADPAARAALPPACR